MSRRRNNCNILIKYLQFCVDKKKDFFGSHNRAGYALVYGQPTGKDYYLRYSVSAMSGYDSDISQACGSEGEYPDVTAVPTSAVTPYWDVTTNHVVWVWRSLVPSGTVVDLTDE